MKIPEEQIKKCQELYKRHFKIALTEEEALEKIIMLVKMVKSVYEPLLKDNQYDKPRRSNDQS